MCGCCPPAISALFCLWARSGFSKSSVAGALTFFPPSPALYKFERFLDGEPLPDDDDGEQSDEEGKTSEKDELNQPNGSRGSKKNKRGDSDPENFNPAQELTDRVMELRKQAKVRSAADARDQERGVEYRFIPDTRLVEPPGYSGSIEAVKIGPCKKSKSFVAAVIYRIREDRVTDKTKTIIYSHGNATDIGAMHFMQVVIAKGLKCNVVMYDYSGYGESGGVPLEENTYSNIEMVYDHVLENVVANKDENNIILYGQSVGSGPSCYLVAKKPDVGGLILHSPFMSGMRVLTPSRALACLDIFPNINRIKKAQCPVMIIHGMLDEEVNFSHGKSLYEAVPEDLRRTPWWVKDRGHNDITDGRTKLLEYIQRLKGFFDSLEPDWDGSVAT